MGITKSKYCTSKYSTNDLESMHNSKNSGPPYRCSWPDCFVTFKSVYTRNRHYLRIHCFPDAFKCRICDKTFNRNDNLKAHFLGIHPEEEWVECLSIFHSYCCSYYEALSFISNLSSPIFARSSSYNLLAYASETIFFASILRTYGCE